MKTIVLAYNFYICICKCSYVVISFQNENNCSCLQHIHITFKHIIGCNKLSK